MTSCEMQGFCLTVIKIKGLFFFCRSSVSFAFWGLKLSLFAVFSLSIFKRLFTPSWLLLHVCRLHLAAVRRRAALITAPWLAPVFRFHVAHQTVRGVFKRMLV